MSKEEIKQLIELAKDDYRVANKLFISGELRQSVSRIYYSIFYYITAILLTKDMKFKSHKSLLIFFNKEFIKTDVFPKRDNRLLIKTYELRQEADYQLIHHGEKVIEKIIKGVGEFKERAEEYLMNFIEKNQ